MFPHATIHSFSGLLSLHLLQLISQVGSQHTGSVVLYPLCVLHGGGVYRGWERQTGHLLDQEDWVTEREKVPAPSQVWAAVTTGPEGKGRFTSIPSVRLKD